jgi:ketosteroid isomerase-like protein
VDAVRRFWELLEARAWDDAADLLAEDFVCDWPNTGERFRGRDNFMDMNKAYPIPDWHIEVLRTVVDGPNVAAEVRVPSSSGLDFCLGFYEVVDGRIRRATEYWVEQRLQSPAWRAQWVEHA